MKRKLYFWAKSHVTVENTRIVLLFFPLTFIIITQIIHKELNYTDFFNTDLLFSFLLILISNFCASHIVQFIEKKCEDHAKLTPDYSSIIRKYPLENTFTFNSEVFPVTVLACRSINESWSIVIDDYPSSFYQLPGQIKEFSNELMQVHSQSVYYNQINMRLKNIETNLHTVTLHTERTTYYDSLITNRACDYLLSNKKTIRDIYEPGPYLHPLPQSKLSNHLGFNGFVMTNDHQIPFILRGENVTIGKNTLGLSVEASLKTKYCLNSQNDFLMDSVSLGNAILREISDELALEPKQGQDLCEYLKISCEEATESIFAFYRELVECGKPQFLFFLKLKDISSYEIKKCFDQKNREKSLYQEDKVLRDGKTMIFFTVDQLLNSTISSDRITLKTGDHLITYPMMPSASASIAMLINALKK